MASITAANATIMLAIAGLFDTPQQIQGFAADDVFSVEPTDVTETLRGVDGKLSGGFVYGDLPWSITLQADSASNAIFDAWVAGQITAQDVYTANAVVLLRSLNAKWTMTKGFLKKWPSMPDAKKLLQPRKFLIEWESISKAAAT